MVLKLMTARVIHKTSITVQELKEITVEYSVTLQMGDY